MKKLLLINWIIFKNAYIRDKEIPGVIISSLLFEITEIFISIVFFNILFSSSKSIGGWNFYQVLFLYSFAKTIGGINAGWLKKGVQSMATELIRKGDLDFFLTKPIDAMVFFSISKPRLYSFINCIFSIGLGIYSIEKGGIHIGFLNFAWFLMMAVCGVFLFWFLSLITVFPSFWFVRLWSLQSIMYRLNQFMRYPAGVFSPILKAALFAIFPIMAVSYVPVSVLFGPLKWQSILYMLTVTLIFGMITRMFWQKGLRKYSSASS